MKIRIPTLIMANVQDFRVPITQSYKLFRALQDHGVETQFLAYPGRTHSPQIRRCTGRATPLGPMGRAAPRLGAGD